MFASQLKVDHLTRGKLVTRTWCFIDLWILHSNAFFIVLIYIYQFSILIKHIENIKTEKSNDNNNNNNKPAWLLSNNSIIFAVFV